MRVRKFTRAMILCVCVRSIILLPRLVGTSFVLVVLTRLNVREPHHIEQVLTSHFRGEKESNTWVFLLNQIIFNLIFLVLQITFKKSEVFFSWNHVFKPDRQTGLPDNKNCKMFSSQGMKQKIFLLKCMILVQQVYIVVTYNLHEIIFSSLTVKQKYQLWTW